MTKCLGRGKPYCELMTHRHFRAADPIARREVTMAWCTACIDNLRSGFLAKFGFELPCREITPDEVVVYEVMES